MMTHISFVFQNEKLFKTSVRDNVSLMVAKGVTEEQLRRALVNTQCMELIEKLPDGLDTVIGAKGIYLSGGEQQRIALSKLSSRMHRYYY